MEKLRIKPEVVDRARAWLVGRGGIAVWKSIWLSDPGLLVLTPALTDGKPTPKPSWQLGDEAEVITDGSGVGVVIPKEVRRFRIHVRMGSNGLLIKLTDHSSELVRKMLAKYGEDAWHEFGGDDGFDCIIFVPGSLCPLSEFKG